MTSVVSWVSICAGSHAPETWGLGMKYYYDAGHLWDTKYVGTLYCLHY